MTGARRAARRVRSGSRSSAAAITARPSASPSTGEALRALPAIDRAMSTGALTLDQAAAAAKHATPETDAEIARIAVGKAPSEIALAARTLVPPKVADDHELYARRALSMTWTPDRRELVFGGRLPLEQGAAFEQAIWNIATQQRAADKKTGEILDWQQSAADALVTLAENGGTKQRREAQPDDADRAPQRRRAPDARGRRADQRRDRRAPHLRRPPPHHQAARPRPRALTRRPLRLLPAAARAAQPHRALPVPRLHRHPRTRGTPHHRRSSAAARPNSPT